MSSIIKAIESAYQKKEERGWDVIYFLIDIHDTILKGSYSEVDEFEFLGKAKECLQYLSARKDVVLILWSSISLTKANWYLERFKELGIKFQEFNSNPRESSNELSDFTGKFYFSVGIDDKFGFEPEQDWKNILDYYEKK